VSLESAGEPSQRQGRLESWKEIAAYLDRSERTVRRWEEREGLPVHRLHHEKRGSIYAYTYELDGWRESRRPRRSRHRLVAALAIALTAAGAFIPFARRAPSTDSSPIPEAVRAYRLGEFAGNAGRVQVASGIRHYQEAIRLDPRFADAWSALAYAHIAQTFFGDRPAKETLSEARREARRAGQLDPSLVAPGVAVAAVSHYLDWDHAAAEKQFLTSIRLAPDVAVTHSWLAELFLDLRRFDDAAACARKAQDVDPRWLEPIVVAGNILAFAGHVDLAIAEYQRALAIEPSFGLANHFLGRAYLAKGDHERAVRQLRKSNELLGEVPFTIGDLGYALAVSGARMEAERIMAALMARRERDFHPAFPIAVINLGLGDHDAALDWIERAADERHLGYYMPSVDPIYDSVRAHPRFQAVLQRMNLDR
jgi:serine/threonine-protein kinase